MSSKGITARLRAARKRKADRMLARVNALVSARDVSCRRCGSYYALHHHHILWRSRGGQHTTQNLVLVCAACHRLIHDHLLDVSGDADGTLIWSAR